MIGGGGGTSVGIGGFKSSELPAGPIICPPGPNISLGLTPSLNSSKTCGGCSGGGSGISLPSPDDPRSSASCLCKSSI